MEREVSNPSETTYHGGVGTICSNDEYATLSRSAITSHSVFLSLAASTRVRLFREGTGSFPHTMPHWMVWLSVLLSLLPGSYLPRTLP